MGRKPKAVHNPVLAQFFNVGPQSQAISGPEALNREAVTTSQVDPNEKTIIWGVNDSLPIRVMDAVNKSPTATACIAETETFIMGEKFSDEGLMTMVVDKEGTTLWQLHGQFCPYSAILEAFAARFTFDGGKKITNTYSMGVENLRFVEPKASKSKHISEIKHNPYFGTGEYASEFTQSYFTWNPVELPTQLKLGTKFTGQVYFNGSVRPPYKFYPVPKYWSGEKWIYVDAGIQEFHKSNIDNGFFQSVLLQMIGDPTQLSKNPKYYSDVVGDDEVTRRENVGKVTVGQEFSEMMSARFSGAKKAGTVMALWALTKELSANLQAFPTNTNFDVLAGTFLDTIRGITIATGVPAILANLPQQASSLGSDGRSMQAATELMQARTAKRRNELENFYNTIMLPNLQKSTKARVKIVNNQPISVEVNIPDNVWNSLSQNEKRNTIKENYPNIKLDEVAAAVPAVDPETGEPLPVEPEQKVNENIKNMTGRQLQGIQRIVRQFNKEQLTFEQAAKLLKDGFGFTDEDVNIWLITPEEV